MKKMNSKGFTLIELLAVIVIMGILMMVAIPAMTRYIENSRKDTFLDTAKQYANAVKNMWVSDSLICGTVPSSANDAGTYYVEIDSSTNKNNLLESGGTSSWGNRGVKGYVRVVVSEGAKNVETDYYVALSDDIHGIKDVTGAGAVTSDKLSRGKVETKNVRFTDVAIPAGTTKCVEQ